MRPTIMQQMSEGVTLGELCEALNGIQVAECAISAGADLRARPYLRHTVAGWTDGPPGSNVLVVISGADPTRAVWRRFALKKTGYSTVALDAFPTPFNNPEAPLAPGIPPGASRRMA
jgi:hypothetical protein